MLAGKRSERIGDRIRKETAVLLLEKVKDPRVGNVTVTGVHLSRDLKAAKVYYSTIGDKERINKAQTGLDSAKGFIKKEIGSRLKLRYVPDITFVHDPTLEQAARMEKILKDLRMDESESAGREDSGSSE